MKMKHNEINRRYLELIDLSLETEKREGETPIFKIRGKPIVYGREAVLYDSETFKWIEVIEKGAATEALKRAEQVLLWNHEAAKPMAARKNNTLEVGEDEFGVHIEADVSGTVWGREGFEAIQNRLVDKMSFGFYVKEDGYSEERTTEGNKRVLKRTIKKFDRIIDFSPVTYPAYEDTSVSERDAVSIIAVEKEQEELKKREIQETKNKINCLLDFYKEQII